MYAIRSYYVQATAGNGSGFADEAYVGAGAKILPTIDEVYAIAEMIIKVKEPIEPEYKLIKKGQILYTYFHFASCEPLLKAMIESVITSYSIHYTKLYDCEPSLTRQKRLCKNWSMFFMNSV